MGFAFCPHSARWNWSPQNCTTFESGTVTWFTVSSHFKLLSDIIAELFYHHKNAGCKKLSPLEFSVCESAEGFVVPSVSSWSSTLCLPHVCFADLFPETRKGAQLFSLPRLSVPSTDCWAKSSVSPGRFTGVAHTQSGFSSLELLLKTSAKCYQQGRKVHKVWSVVGQLLKYQLEWSGMPCTSLIFYIEQETVALRKSLLTPQTPLRNLAQYRVR